AVIALVMDAIHTTVSEVMGASLPSSRLPKAPSYSTPSSVTAAATMPGIVFDSTAWLKIVSMLVRLGMAPSPSDARASNTRRCGGASLLAPSSTVYHGSSAVKLDGLERLADEISIGPHGSRATRSPRIAPPTLDRRRPRV